MADRPSKKVNVREFIEAQVKGLLESPELEAKIRESTEGIVMEVLSEHDPSGGGGGLSEEAVRAIVQAEIEAAGGGGGGGEGGGLSMNQIRRVVAELIEAAIGDDLDSTQNSSPEATREIVREEIAAAGVGIDMEAVSALVQNEVAGLDLGGGGGGGGGEGGGLSEDAIRTIVAETLKTEAGALVSKVRESVQGLVAKSLKARNVVSREELDEALASVPLGGGGGEGDGGGMEPRAVKALVKDVVNAEAPSRDEVTRMIRHQGGASGGALTRDEVVEIVKNEITDADLGGGGGDVSIDPDIIRALIAEEMAATPPMEGGGLDLHAVQAMVAEQLAATPPPEPAGPDLAAIQAMVAEQLAAAPQPEASGGVDEETVRAIVAEAVAGLGGGEGSGGEGGGGLDAETIRAVIADEVGKAMAAAGGGGGGGGGGDGGAIDADAFVNSNAMKEALEDRFRLMQTYIKTDLVPKLVKKAMSEG